MCETSDDSRRVPGRQRQAPAGQFAAVRGTMARLRPATFSQASQVDPPLEGLFPRSTDMTDLLKPFAFGSREVDDA